MKNFEELKKEMNNNPELKKVADEVNDIFNRADLSHQLAIKIWAALSLCKHGKTNDPLFMDILFKGVNLLKSAHTIELMGMLLKPMKDQEAGLWDRTGREIFLEFGATFETVHNAALMNLKREQDQFKNLTDLIAIPAKEDIVPVSS